MTITRKPKNQSYKGFKYPKPTARKKEAVKVLRDGREVCSKTPAGRAEYRKRTEEMVCRQSHLCGICGEIMRMDEATFDHVDLRGLGGGRRDDRIQDAQGNWMNRAVHGRCNSIRGSRRDM